MSQLPTLTTFPVLPNVPLQQPRHRQTRGALVSGYDVHMSRAHPGHKPMDPEILKQMLFAMGATEDTLGEVLERNNQWWDRTFAKGNGTLPSLGKKPELNDPAVLYVDIPGTDYSIRIWDGGMASRRQYCIDYFDTRRNTPINKPDGFDIYPVGMSGPGFLAFNGPLISWEEAMRVEHQHLRPGAEKFSAPEGSHLALRRHGHPDLVFEVPLRRTPAPAYQLVQPAPRPHVGRR
ncbi:hypothetical protein A0H81_11458 [Grifola frondosa]|uniref:Uncharacterized protein n=1 Tax=Grifola frondosa TaxID=5627 RepID=A0A1C7LWC5_GRIFR|nr:hypothetical protein A0H81_11458 [Grifola frondosa]